MSGPFTVVTGAAGFVGSHLCDRLLAAGARVIGIDNLRLGRREHLSHALERPDFWFLEGDLNDQPLCSRRVLELTQGHPVSAVWHLAANSDIRAGTADPEVDLRDTFLTTFHVLRMLPAWGCRRLAFASTSAIYGEYPGLLTEDTGPLRPISNYGAMKLASEAIVSAALETTLDCAWVFRFPNVVGSRATHGVIIDFLAKLRANPDELEVLGDGNQEKPYLHVSELLDAMLFIARKTGAGWNCFNIGPEGTATTVRQIAELVVQQVAPRARIRYTGGPKGWPGDVPRFGYSIERLRCLGWAPTLGSTQAIELALRELAESEP